MATDDFNNALTLKHLDIHQMPVNSRVIGGLKIEVSGSAITSDNNAGKADIDPDKTGMTGSDEAMLYTWIPITVQAYNHTGNTIANQGFMGIAHAAVPFDSSTAVQAADALNKKAKCTVTAVLRYNDDGSIKENMTHQLSNAYIVNHAIKQQGDDNKSVLLLTFAYPAATLTANAHGNKEAKLGAGQSL